MSSPRRGLPTPPLSAPSKSSSGNKYDNNVTNSPRPRSSSQQQAAKIILQSSKFASDEVESSRPSSSRRRSRSRPRNSSNDGGANDVVATSGNANNMTATSSRKSLRRKSSTQSAAMSSADYLAEAEAIVADSPISPRQIFSNTSVSTSNYYSPKSPRKVPPPPPPRTSSFQRSSSHGSATLSPSPRHSAPAASPLTPKSPRPPPPPLTSNNNIPMQQARRSSRRDSLQSNCSTSSIGLDDSEEQRDGIISDRSGNQEQLIPSSSSWRHQPYNNSVGSFQSTGSSSSRRRNSQTQQQKQQQQNRRLSHQSVDDNLEEEKYEEQSLDSDDESSEHSSVKTVDDDDLNRSHRSLGTTGSNSHPSLRAARVTSRHYDTMTSSSSPIQQQHVTNDHESTTSSTISNNDNKCTSILKSLLCIFPKLEPLPWTTFTLLFLWCLIPPACYIIFFTQMGLGDNIYYVISERFGEYAYSLTLGLIAAILGLYMLDAECWSGKFALVFLDFCTMVIVLGVVLLVLCIADQFPYGMVCLFAIFQPLWLLAVKLIFYVEVDTRVYVSWLSGPLFLTSLCTGIAWCVWVFSNPENQWNVLVRVELAQQSGCLPNYEEYPDCRTGGMNSTQEDTCFYIENDVLVFPEGCEQSCTGVYNDCTNGFILWVGPVLVSMTIFFLSFFCTFLRTEGTKEKDVFNFGKVWLFILFAIWVTTSLSGMSSGVTSALAALTLASFVASAVFIAFSFDREERDANASAVFKRLRDKYGENLDIARGLFVVTCAPILLIYLALSVINQLIRKTRIFPCSEPVGDSNDKFTTRTRIQINQMKTWDRARVYTFAVYWGIFFMVMQVLVAKLTVVFLSWLIEQTASFGLGAVTAILVGVGVTMFLLPPVPGVPVYLTLGIVLPAQGHETLGWIGSVGYSIAIGLVLKLFSSALQQKVIGENLSRYVRVRQFVGVNSTLMKAMRLVLSEDGLSVPKVSILIGGPDWPTSVLCGILRLSLPQIMLGTLPVVLLITPTCVTGALLYMASLKDESGNPEFSWAGTVSTITASLTALVQFGSMIVAAYYLEQAADKRADDVAAIEDDAEVKKADDESALLKRYYRKVTRWNEIPVLPKLLMRLSLACIVTSCYIVQLFSSRCFTDHTLTDSIDDNLQGNVGNLFLPLGWVATFLFVASAVLLYAFIRWGNSKAKKKAKENAPNPEALAHSSSDRTGSDLDLHAAAEGINHNNSVASYNVRRHSDSHGAHSTSTRF